jgi:1,4-dihydroxy-2-naphthoate polyprenyltransferase
VGKWIKASRIYVMGASLLPVVLGGALAYAERHAFNLFSFILSLAGVGFIHIGSNLINDYFDDKSGVDRDNPDAVYPFSGGSRVLTDGDLTPEAVRKGAFACYGLAAAIGLWLSFTVSAWVFALGTFGVLTGYLYVHPKFNLLNHGMGELLVGLDFGLLTAMGAYLVQTGTFSLSSSMAALPVGVLISLILIMNEFPDYAGDIKAGKRTLVVRLGRKHAAKAVCILFILTGFLVVLDVLAGWTSPWCLTAFLAAPYAWKACRVALVRYDEIPALVPANVCVIKAHLFVNLWLAAAVVTAVRLLPGLAAMFIVLAFQLKSMLKDGLLTGKPA